MVEENKYEMRELFLNSFIGTIIRGRNNPVKEDVIPTEKSEFLQIQQKPSQDNLMTKEGFMPSIMDSQNTEVPEKQLEPIEETTQYQQQIPIQNAPPPMYEQIPLSHFDKLNSLINNPSISSIECPGPGRNLIITQQGFIKTIPLTLTQDEINEVMMDISEKTRIPMIEGGFRATLDELIISAVISEFVGTRFYIQKKPSYQHY